MGTTFEAIAPLLLQGLSAALRLLRWARSQSQGCDWQFGLARTALPERSVGTTWKPKAPRQRREDCPAAAEGLRPAWHPLFTHHTKASILSHSATQPLSHSATQPLSHSAMLT
ncbi:TPA: hypothetical protein JD264_02225 [Serratia fonticola]|nr:hypothetical protein [Serratia fonticola]